MKTILVLLGTALVGLSAAAESLSEHYAAEGELILTPMASAPFPHPKREEGHRYKDQFFPAKEHYSDSTVGIFIPKGFRETGRIDFVVHFHGWNNNVEGVFRQYHLVEQLLASGCNAVLVVPQGPRNASDSFGGKLEDPDGFKRFMAEVAATLRQKSNLHQKGFVVGNVILSGHSGGYRVISAILDRGGSSSQVKEVWLFDALYAETDKFLAWSDLYHGRLIDLYTEHGGTKEETENLIRLLKERGTPAFTSQDTETRPRDLRDHHLIFLYTTLAHNDVVDGRKAFQEFLATSCLGTR